MPSLPRFSVNNPILVNLMMYAVLGGGVYCAFTLVREMFPESRPNQVTVQSVYPGATPAEVEKGISLKIEEKIKNIEGVDEIHTTISEGLSTINVRLLNDVSDVDQVVTDVKAAIDTIPRDDFPEDAEESRVFKFEPRMPVISVTVFGDLSDTALKAIGKRLRDDILALPGVTDVEMWGMPREEITVEVSAQRLVEYRLSFMEVRDAIARANLDLPGGQVKTPGGNVAVRTLGEKDRGAALERIIVRSDPSGKVLRLNQIGRVVDGFEDVDIVGRCNAQPSVSVTAYKTADQDAIDIAMKVRAMVAGKRHEPLERDWLARLRARMGIPDEIDKIHQAAYNDPYVGNFSSITHNDLARFIESRLSLVKRNGAWGLLFVFLSLFLFLHWRVAFWVMMGLVLSIAGTLIVMKTLGLTLNLVSMFGLIIVLGMLVDDAIIIGERIFTRVEDGEAPKLAAVVGAEEVGWPVITAITTTIVAFVPLLFIEGQIGDFMGVLPVIVVCALSVSLVEAFSILPSHLAESLQRLRPRDGAAAEHRGRLRQRLHGVQQHMLQRWLQGGYERLLRKSVSYRYVTLAGICGAMIVTLGMIAGGRVPLVFVQNVDSETLIAGMKMPVGTPIAETDEAMQVIERAVMDVPELATAYTILGVQFDASGVNTTIGSHVGQMFIELKPVEERERTSEDVLRDLRAATGDIPGVNALRFESIQGGPGGDPIHIDVTGERLADLVAVAERIKHRLASFAGVYDVTDNFEAGRREVQIELLDSGRALGLTTQSLATQVRGAFYGLEARKVQRGREDVKIMVRYADADRRQIYDVESMWIATPSGDMVPFSEVARLREGRGYAVIHRKDRKRTVAVTAAVDDTVSNPQEINATLQGEFPALERAFPGTRLSFGGQQQEFLKSFSSLGRDFVIAALLIYVLLAALFKSYVQPVIVMAAIPFGLIGATLGHYLMGYPLTVVSQIGLVALSGIVVNDSLILVTFVNREVARGRPVFEAVIIGGKARLRAILLTSITTILGLAPLLAEQSFQARFLIPMGISIAFGLAFATILTLIAVPSLYMMLDDAKRLVAVLRHLLPLPTPAKA